VRLVGAPPAVGVTTIPVFSFPKLRYFWPAPSIAAEGGSPLGQLFKPPRVPTVPIFIVAECATDANAMVDTRIDLIPLFYAIVESWQEIKPKIIMNRINNINENLFMSDYW
jgi:hypothetical protein